MTEALRVPAPRGVLLVSPDRCNAFSEQRLVGAYAGHETGDKGNNDGEEDRDST